MDPEIESGITPSQQESFIGQSTLDWVLRSGKASATHLLIKGYSWARMGLKEMFEAPLFLKSPGTSAWPPRHDTGPEVVKCAKMTQVNPPVETSISERMDTKPYRDVNRCTGKY